jgi:hypothetical protein
MRSESSRLANMIALSRASESSRLMSAIAAQKDCANPAKARVSTQSPCIGCNKLDLSGGFLGNNVPVPSSSSRLLSDTLACDNRGGRISGPETGIPQSAWIARLQQRTLDNSTDPSNPDSRFSAYRRPFIQICPPIPQSYLNAGEPVLQGKSCPLPNKPDNMILPG